MLAQIQAGWGGICREDAQRKGFGWLGVEKMSKGRDSGGWGGCRRLLPSSGWLQSYYGWPLIASMVGIAMQSETCLHHKYEIIDK